MKIENRTELKEYRIECQKKQSADCRVLVCGGTGCLASGSGKIYEKLKELTKDHTGVEVKIGEEIAHTKVMKSGCHGFCEMGPLVRIEPYNYLYIKVKLEDCEEIYNETILGGRPVERLLYKMDGVTYPSQEEIPFYAKQTRLVLKNCGHIDAEHIGGALAVGAYAGIEKALFEMTPEAVIQTIYDSNLRGRGGAGFRTGRKWQQVASQKEKIRYVVCNGDEGDPGAFMDRSIMEGDPHRMIEGMMIAAYAVQAQEGYIYVRAEYQLATNLLAALSAYEKKTAFLAKVGDDTFGRLLVGTMQRAGIDGRGIRIDPDTFTTLAFVTFDAHGDRSFAFARKPGADTQLRWDEIDPAMLDETHVFHFGSLSCTDEPARSATQSAVAYARAHGKLVTYDPNYRPPLWKTEQEAKEQILWGLRQADLVKISDEEVQFLWGCSPEQGAERVLALGAKLVMVTLGPKGCFLKNAQAEYRCGCPQVRTVDTTGAGDIFGGSAVSRFLELGKTPEQLTQEDLAYMARYASAAASLSTEKSGAIPSIPAKEAVLQKMQEAY